jgi:hypothetical protein
VFVHKDRFVRLVVSGLVLSLAVLFGIAVPAGAAGRAGITVSASAGPAGASVTIPATTAATVVVTAKTGTASASAPYTVTYSPASTTAGREGVSEAARAASTNALAAAPAAGDS